MPNEKAHDNCLLSDSYSPKLLETALSADPLS